MSRSKNLTDDDIEKIVRILDGWSGVLRWNLLIEEVHKTLFRKYTRQTLDKHPRIKAAFIQRKNAIAAAGPATPKATVSPEKQLDLDRISRLEAELARVKAENNRLLEQFNRWAYNASLRNLDEAYLSQELPPVDRDQTKQRRHRSSAAKAKEDGNG